MKLQTIFLTILVPLLQINVLSQTANLFKDKSRNDQVKTIYIRGKITEGLHEVQTIQLLYDLKYRSFHYDPLNFDSKVKPVSDEFIWILPPAKSAKKITNIVIDYTNEPVFNAFNNLNNYIVEPGDSIVMSLKFTPRPIATFSGNGAAKYNCRSSLEQLLWEFDSSSRDGWFHLNKDPELWDIGNLELILQKHSVLQDTLLWVLNASKHKLKAPIYESMKADIIAEVGQMLLSVFNIFLQTNRNVSIDQQKLLSLFDQFNNFNTISAPIDLIPNYAAYLANKSAIELLVKKPSVAPKFHDIYFSIKNKYSDKLREAILFLLLTDENLLVNLFESRFSKLKQREALHYVKDFKSIAKAKLIIEKFELFANRYNIGQPAYPFKLLNAIGDTVKLSDFYGKVVVIDMWFTGCGGCAHFAHNFRKNIKPLFMNEPDLKIVSICTDINKNRWLKSLTSETYSEKTDINLYTNGDGFGHEIVDYYGISGLPFAILIDKKGRVAEVITELNNEIIIKEIKTNLEEK